MPGTVPTIACRLAHLNLIATVTALGGSYYSHPYFTDKKTEAERDEGTKSTQLTHNLNPGSRGHALNHSTSVQLEKLYLTILATSLSVDGNEIPKPVSDSILITSP